MSLIPSVARGWLVRLVRKPVAATPMLMMAEREDIRTYADTGMGKQAALAAYAAARGRGVPLDGAAMLFMREVDNPVADPGLRQRRRMAVQKGGF